MGRFDKLINDMGSHSLKDYPREAVGIITKNFNYIPCKNISEDPTQTFFLDPEALITYNDDIWGIFHSHPGQDNPIPSSEDKKSAALDKYKFIVGFKDKFFIYWLDKRVNALLFEPLKEEHIVS